jgi:putative GTP pyrophosphokinase
MSGERENAFLDRWRREEPIYAAWGRFVANDLAESIRGRVAPTALELFVRIPVQSRVKPEDSLLQKAFYRNKAYTDPYAEIEDKVGVRFVVLLSEDIRIIESAILAGTHWIATKARDFAEERDANPYEFDYQSVHYVVRSRFPFDHDGQTVPLDLPCEIQIRTLLQHAYSELTHDTIYKPTVKATPALKRAAAKSMALIEATDDYFRQVDTTIKQALADDRKLTAFLGEQFRSATGVDGLPTPLNSILVDHYKRFAGNSFETAFPEWLKRKEFIVEQIKGRASSTALYRTPAVLLVYYSVSTAQNAAKDNSPLSDSELAPIYSDLGLALSG